MVIQGHSIEVRGDFTIEMAMSQYAYTIKGFRAYFPRFTKAGSFTVEGKVPEGVISMQYSAAYGSTWKHDRLLFALIKGMTDKYNTETARVKRKELSPMPLTMINQYTKYGFSMKELAGSVRGRTANKDDIRDTHNKLAQIATTSLAFVLDGKDGMRGDTFQWLALPKFEGDDAAILVNGLFMKFLLENPLRICYERLMSIHDEKGGRAALLIEESKFSKRWADYITHDEVMKHISPRTQRGQNVTIGEIQDSFIVASEAGYPSYVAGLTADNRLTWCKSDSKKAQVVITHFNNSFLDGSLKRRLKEGMRCIK